LIDTHCHLDVERFDEDRDEVLARAFAAGVQGLVIPAIGPSSWEPLLEWTAREPRVAVGLGIHPQLLPALPEAEDEPALERLDALLARGGAAAVGECGLDGGSLEGAPLERQLRVLRAHWALARKHQLPVLLHCLRAHPALVEFFKTETFPEAGILMHSYSGGMDLAKFYAARGCHFSFAGPVSFAEARKPLDALRAVPFERLMLETDAPDQAPAPHRGKRSEPAYLRHIVEGAARALGRPTDEVATATTRTARSFFKREFSLR
jgi:TatD DNase family protein